MPLRMEPMLALKSRLSINEWWSVCERSFPAPVLNYLATNRHLTSGLLTSPLSVVEPRYSDWGAVPVLAQHRAAGTTSNAFMSR